jgi:probable addiction module antidote protein
MADQISPSDTPDGGPALDTLEGIADRLAAAFESGDPDAMVQAMAAVARSRGLPHLAAAAGMPRAELAAALASGEMSLETTLAIMKVIDLHRPAGGAPN